MTSFDSNFTSNAKRTNREPNEQESEEVELRELGRQQRIAAQLDRADSSASDMKEGGNPSA